LFQTASVAARMIELDAKPVLLRRSENPSPYHPAVHVFGGRADESKHFGFKGFRKNEIHNRAFSKGRLAMEERLLLTFSKATPEHWHSFDYHVSGFR
jgi:hypothetical protein